MKSQNDSAVIYQYTRNQALADGVLVNASVGKLAEISQQHYKWPIAMTAAVYQLLQDAVEDEGSGNSWLGVWHDVLWMSKIAGQSIIPCVRIFKVLLYMSHEHREYELKIVSGPDDLGKPCLTVMLPHED